MRLLHTDAFTQRSFSTQTLLHIEACTHRSFYAQRFSHGSFTQGSFYTEKSLNRASFIHRSISTHKSFTYTQSFYTPLLRIEACSQSLQTEGLTQRGLYTEQLLHTDAFTQRCTEQLLHTEAFTHRSFCAQEFLHISFTQTSFYTKKPLHKASFIHRSIYTHTHTSFTHTPLHTELLHTDAFTHRKLVHRAGFTQSSFYTPKLLHRERPLQAFHRSFYTEKLLRTGAFTHRRVLHTEACTHGGFYAQKLSHREASTHRRFPTEKPIPQSSFYTFQKIILRKFLTFGHHIARKGCIRRWKITIYDVGQSFCVKGLCLTLQNRNFTQVLFRTTWLCLTCQNG